jgi:hypothetical protein
MEVLPDFEEQYFERKGVIVKKLLEEAIPIAHIGLHLFRFFEEPFVTCFAEGHPVDGVLEFAGHRPRELKLEITTTETDETVLRRQALSRDGTVFMTGPIRREGRKIISTPKMIDPSVAEDRLVDLAFDRFERKAQSGRYSTDTAIVVTIIMQNAPSMRRRGLLLERTRQWLRSHPEKVFGGYYCYLRSGIIDSAQASDREMP